MTLRRDDAQSFSLVGGWHFAVPRTYRLYLPKCVIGLKKKTTLDNKKRRGVGFTVLQS